MFISDRVTVEVGIFKTEESRSVMKKSIRLIVSMLVICVMLSGLTACSADMNKMKGEWKVKTVNGKSVSDYGLETGAYIGNNVNITDEKIIISKITNGEVTTDSYEIEVKSNGVEGYVNKGDANPAVAFELLPEDNTLKLANTNGTVIIYEPGTSDLVAEFKKLTEDYYSKVSDNKDDDSSDAGDGVSENEME